MKQAITRSEQQQRLKRNEQKWTRTLMDAGWTVFPSVVLERQNALGLDPTDVNILLQLARYWWFSDNPPRPSKAAIARAMNISVSTVRKHVARMESEGLIRRQGRYSGKHKGQQPNAYHFDGLIEKCKAFALEAIQDKERHRKENEERTKRKRARFSVVTAKPDPGSGRPA
jgi:DNA-binding Lrp family transcriptional regulator